ncbi:MAG TPA: hypothetical protein GX503_01115 [Clostridiales bacterium]|nr:hypothetical protein [Clostridiales bacterium]
MNRRIFQNNEGLTFIEAIISVAVIIIMSAPLLTLLLNAVKINLRTEEEMIATLLAQNEIEKIKGNEILWLGENQVEEKDEEGQIVKMMHTKNQNGFEVISTINAVKDFQFHESFIMKIKIADNQLEIYEYDETGEMLGKNVLKKNIQFLKIQKETLGTQNHYRISLYCDNFMVPIASLEKAGVPANVKIEIHDIHRPFEIMGTNLDNDHLFKQDNLLNLYILRNSPAPAGISQQEIKTEGNVAVYDNLPIHFYRYRLYQIEITVKKENKVLETIKGYKTFLTR